jgi:hypothetical protein
MPSNLFSIRLLMEPRSYWKYYREPTSGLEPLTCSLRVIIQVLQGFARACKSRISRPVSLLRLAACCTVLRPRWCQSGVKRCQEFGRLRSRVSLRVSLIPATLSKRSTG